MEFPDGHLRTRTLRTIPVSRRSLEMRFKNLTGQTLQTEIWRAHLDRAKRLLLETDLSIYEVGENSGFRTSATFNVMFRRAIGMTPTEFRRQVKLPTVSMPCFAPARPKTPCPQATSSRRSPAFRFNIRNTPGIMSF